MTRKVFLTMLAVASMAVAAEPTAAEKANLDVVTRFCAAFATRDMAKIGEFLAADVVYRITDTAPTVKGAEAEIAKIDPALATNELIFPTAATKSRLKVWGDVSAEDQAYFDEQFSAVVEGVGA